MKSLFIPLILVVLFSRCVALFITNSMEKALVGEVEVSVPVLKYSIISTLEEMYCANIKAPEKGKSYYENVSADSKAQAPCI